MIHIFNLQSSNSNPSAMRPDWFSFERTFKNLLDTIDFNRCKLHIVFDGNSDNHFINKYKEKYNFTINHISGGNGFISNQLLFEYIKKQENIKPDDLIYALEWDYLHLDYWIDAILDLYDCNPNDNIDNCYISLFSHPDKVYFKKKNAPNPWNIYCGLKQELFITKYSYWGTTPSTCASFLMKKSLFDKDYDILSQPKADNERFPKLLERGREVLQPYLGLATHCDKIFLTPFINWQKISDDVKLL